jgi:hypothetical protein
LATAKTEKHKKYQQNELLFSDGTTTEGIGGQPE